MSLWVCQMKTSELCSISVKCALYIPKFWSYMDHRMLRITSASSLLSVRVQTDIRLTSDRRVRYGPHFSDTSHVTILLLHIPARLSRIIWQRRLTTEHLHCANSVNLAVSQSLETIHCQGTETHYVRVRNLSMNLSSRRQNCLESPTSLLLLRMTFTVWILHKQDDHHQMHWQEEDPPAVYCPRSIPYCCLYLCILYRRQIRHILHLSRDDHHRIHSKSISKV